MRFLNGPLAALLLASCSPAFAQPTADQAAKLDQIDANATALQQSAASVAADATAIKAATADMRRLLTPVPVPPPVVTPPPAATAALGVPAGYTAIYTVDWRSQGFGGAWGFANARYRSASKAGINGFGYEFFIDPFAPGVPADYLAANPIGPFEVLPGQGLGLKCTAAPASVISLAKKQGLGSDNKVAVSWVGAYTTTWGKMAIKPPFLVVFYAKVEDVAAGGWSGLWGLGSKDGVGPKVERDIHEGFAGNPGMNFSLHLDAKGYNGGFWQEGPWANPALNTGVHQFALWVAADGSHSPMLDGKVLATLSPADMLNDPGILEPFVPILNEACGFPWSGGFAPKRALQTIVERFEVYAPSAAGSIIPAAPPAAPAITWASSTIPVNSPIGTVVGRLSGATGLIDRTGSLKASGSNVVVAKQLTAGTLAVVPSIGGPDGAVYGATYRMTVK